MRTWLKRCSFMLLALLIPLLIIQVNESSITASQCCLCDTMRYHAPCLVDLETGTITELSIYDPHPTITGELAEEQYTTGTFSLVTCGEAQGYRDTTHKKVEMVVPDTKLAGQTALCESCRDRYAVSIEERYVLMDLYEKENVYCIPMIDQKISIRCYELVISKQARGIFLTVLGMITEIP